MPELAAVTLAELITIRGLLRSESYTNELAAANISDGTDTARAITLKPRTGETKHDWIIVTRISAQGIAPDNLIIDARDMNRASFRLHLPPDLVISDVLLIGGDAGVTLTIRNSAARVVPVVIHASTFSGRQLAQTFGVDEVGQLAQIIRGIKPGSA